MENTHDVEFRHTGGGRGWGEEMRRNFNEPLIWRRSWNNFKFSTGPQVQFYSLVCWSTLSCCRTKSSCAATVWKITNFLQWYAQSNRLRHYACTHSHNSKWSVYIKAMKQEIGQVQYLTRNVFQMRNGIQFQKHQLEFLLKVPISTEISPTESKHVRMDP
jgi:hypothetical protein